MRPNFSEGVRQGIYAAQNGFCAVDGCLERIVDIHHRLSNTKVNQKLFPLFLQSPFNGEGICRGHHQGPEKEQFKITEQQARMYEEYLQKIKDGIIK